jgi:hypothetical protein
MENSQPTEQDDQANPYAPPRSELVGQQVPFSGTRGRPGFSVEDIAGWSWSLYKIRFKHCLGAFWGVVTINWLCQMSIVILDEGIASLRDPALSRLSQFAAMFLSIVVAVWLTIGQSIAFLRIARGQLVGLQHLFAGGRFLLTTILAGLLFFAALALPFLALNSLAFVFLETILAAPSLAGVLGLVTVFLAGAVAVFYLFVRLGFFMYVVIDQNAGVFSSLALAWQLCKGRMATLTLVYLLVLTINLAGFLMLCVGWIFTLPFCSLIFAVAYRALTGWGTVFGGSTLDGEE